MTDSKEKKKGLLQQIWSRTEEYLDDLKVNRAAKSLKLQAQQDLLDLQVKIEEKTSEFEKAVDKAKEERNFKACRDANLEVVVAIEELEQGKELYKRFFEEDPSSFLEA